MPPCSTGKAVCAATVTANMGQRTTVIIHAPATPARLAAAITPTACIPQEAVQQAVQLQLKRAAIVGIVSLKSVIADRNAI